MYKDDICPIHNLAAFDGFLWIRTYKASRGFPATSLLSFLCNFLSKLFVIYYRCGRKRYSSETPTFPGVVQNSDELIYIWSLHIHALIVEAV